MQAARFIAEAEMPPLAAGLTMPLLTVQGEEDRVASAATNAELLAAALPHALTPKEAEFVDTVPPAISAATSDGGTKRGATYRFRSETAMLAWSGSP